MQSEAEDAGGLTPTKDDNKALRKSSPKSNAIIWLGGVLVTGRGGQGAYRPICKVILS